MSNIRFVIIAMLIIVGMLWLAFGLLRPGQIEKAKNLRNGANEIRLAAHRFREAG